MEKAKLFYLPYRTHYYFSLALAGIGLPFVVGIGYSLSNPEWVLLIPTLFAVAVFLGAKFLYDTSRISVLLLDDGIWVVGQRRLSAQFYAWCDFSYCVQTRSKRGHRFVVLLRDNLPKSQLEQYVAQSANRSTPCIKPFTLVLPIDPLQDTTHLLNYFNNKINNANNSSLL